MEPDGDQDDVQVPAHYNKNQKGGNHLIDAQGFLYRLKRAVDTKDKKYWECTQKKKAVCTATAVTRISTDSIISVGPHSHSINKIQKHVRQIEAMKVNAAATTSTTVPRTVVSEITAAVASSAPGATAYIRSKSALSRAIQRRRVKEMGYPERPKSYVDLAIVPDRLMETADHKSFLILNDTVIRNNPLEDGKRLLVFMSETGRDILAQSTTWYCDGTFKAVSGTPFAQLFMIVGLSAVGKPIPCLFALLPDKVSLTT
jgi:hypothetical protein